MAERVSTRLTAAEGRKFGLTVGIAFLVLAGITWWRDHRTVMTVLASLGGAMCLAGLVVPTLMGPVQKAWMGLALLISKVTTPIFMGIIFFIVIAPIGIIMRILGRNPVVRTPNGDSFWVGRDESPEARSSMDRQF